MLPLGMWPECFAHTRGGAGAVLGGRRAASRRCASPPRRPAGRRCRPPAASVGGRRGLEEGVGATRGAPPAPRPARPAPRPARPAGGWQAARYARPSPPRWPARCPSAQASRASHSPLPRRAGRGRKGEGGPLGRGRGRGKALLLAGCTARHPPRGWPWPGPHVEQR